MFTLVPYTFEHTVLLAYTILYQCPRLLLYLPLNTYRISAIATENTTRAITMEVLDAATIEVLETGVGIGVICLDGAVEVPGYPLGTCIGY